MWIFTPQKLAKTINKGSCHYPWTEKPVSAADYWLQTNLLESGIFEESVGSALLDLGESWQDREVGQKLGDGFHR